MPHILLLTYTFQPFMSLQSLRDYLFGLAFHQQCSPSPDTGFLCWSPFPSSIWTVHCLLISGADIQLSHSTQQPQPSQQQQAPLGTTKQHVNAILWAPPSVSLFFSHWHTWLCIGRTSYQTISCLWFFSFQLAAFLFTDFVMASSSLLCKITFQPLQLQLCITRALPLLAAVLTNVSFMHPKNISSDLKNQVI